DPPKADAAQALARLRDLHVEVKVITGDNDRVAAKVCGDLGLDVLGTLTGAALDELDDDALEAALPQTTIFARVTPEQKSRVIKAQRAIGTTVGFMGEGRRIFSNTVKYVLMGTSSNFGNMFSAGAASLFLSFLPMLPTQILLNNLLYDVSEMTIP